MFQIYYITCKLAHTTLEDGCPRDVLNKLEVHSGALYIASTNSDPNNINITRTIQKRKRIKRINKTSQETNSNWQKIRHDLIKSHRNDKDIKTN